jgi:uncharacterized membrane protein
MPFATGWMAENRFEPLPTAVYGGVLLLAAVAYMILQGQILAAQGPGSMLAAAVGKDFKGKLSPACYFAAIPLAFMNRWLSMGLYIFVALVWLVPDRRIETKLNEEAQD